LQLANLYQHIAKHQLKCPPDIFLFVLCIGVCFPMGKGIYRVVHIPEDECVLLNSREKSPYLICVEVLKAEAPRYAAFVLG